MMSAMVLVVFAVVGTFLLGIASAMTAEPPARSVIPEIEPKHGICPHCGAETFRKAA